MYSTQSKLLILAIQWTIIDACCSNYRQKPTKYTKISAYFIWFEELQIQFLIEKSFQIETCNNRNFRYLWMDLKKKLNLADSQIMLDEWNKWSRNILMCIIIITQKFCQYSIELTFLTSIIIGFIWWMWSLVMVMKFCTGNACAGKCFISFSALSLSLSFHLSIEYLQRELLTFILAHSERNTEYFIGIHQFFEPHCQNYVKYAFIALILIYRTASIQM